MTSDPDWDLAVIGGGAAGFFGALSYCELSPGARVCVFEKNRQLLTKVRISGGGRCNVTHACFDPKTLVRYYPRGGRELMGAFHRWQPRDMLDWFQFRGVRLKTESDGRMFPVTDDSRTIVDCFLEEAKQLGVTLRPRCGVKALRREAEGFRLELGDGTQCLAKRVLLASGGGAHALAEMLGHRIVPCVPSLFTFNIDDPRLEDLSGLSVPKAKVGISAGKSVYEGPLLITHWGLSGPAVLRCSAWEARALHDVHYFCTLRVDWTGGRKDVEAVLDKMRQDHPRKRVMNTPAFALPARLWSRLCTFAGISVDRVWAQLPRAGATALQQELQAGSFQVRGKSTYKDEFVTCGGIALDEVDMRTFASRLCPGLYLAGEVLDIDGITGGFNFQAAWTGARLAAIDCAENRV